MVSGKRANANEWFRLDDALIRVLFDEGWIVARARVAPTLGRGSGGRYGNGEQGSRAALLPLWTDVRTDAPAPTALQFVVPDGGVPGESRGARVARAARGRVVPGAIRVVAVCRS